MEATPPAADQATRPEPAPATPPPPEHLDLALDFPAVDRTTWTTLARAVLTKAGADDDVDPSAALTKSDLSGIAVPPLFLRADDPGVPAVVRAPGSWDVRVLHTDPDAVRANQAILADLEGGATSLWLRVGDGGIAPRNLARALEGVMLDLISVHLDAEPDVAAAVSALTAAAGDTPMRGSAGVDPVARAFRSGDRSAQFVAPRELPAGLRTVTVDGTAWADAGASDVDEIAFATASAVAYLRELDEDFGQVEFRFAVTDRQFPSIAKLRAARRVWARVAELSGVSGPSESAAAVQVQHAVTAAAMYSTRDPWVNMLRATVAGFAAAAGGADAVTVLPFDHAIGRPDPFARRIARNVQAILHDEVSLARVLDPAAGSWYVDSLTDDLAQRAWDRFTAIERAGGIFAALSNGLVGDAVSATADDRDRRIATRAMPLTGVSEFPDLTESVLTRAGVDPAPGLARWSEPYERFRDRADEMADRPTVQLLALGSRSAYAARVGFATNLFAAGGIAVTVETDPAACNGPVVCLCSSDTAYAEDGASAAAAVRSAGAQQVWLAGRVALDGVDGRLYAGCDALDVLERVWDVIAAEAAA